VTISPANSAISVAPQGIIRAALLESGIIAAEDKLSSQDAAWGLEKLQRLIDQWNARRELIFSHSFLEFTLQANHAPHTIGPGGDFQLPTRPVTIVSAAFILNSQSSQPVDSPFLNMRDEDWWAANPLKSLTSSVVTDLYYDAASPLGNCNFFPICDIANPVRLEIWNSLAQAVSQTAKLGFVQGYWEAIVLDLAVRLCPSYNRAVPPDMKEQWNRAMRIIEANNDAPPRISTNSGGMPNSRRSGRPDFNFLTGMRE
jgi:hypothetical protein